MKYLRQQCLKNNFHEGQINCHSFPEIYFLISCIYSDPSLWVYILFNNYSLVTFLMVVALGLSLGFLSFSFSEHRYVVEFIQFNFINIAPKSQEQSAQGASHYEVKTLQ